MLCITLLCTDWLEEPLWTSKVKVDFYPHPLEQRGAAKDRRNGMEKYNIVVHGKSIKLAAVVSSRKIFVIGVDWLAGWLDGWMGGGDKSNPRTGTDTLTCPVCLSGRMSERASERYLNLGED